jgi:hypothetical protein
VSRWRQLTVLISVLFAVTLDTAWSAPLRAAKEARSAVCCARSCAKLRAVTCEAGCCAAKRSTHDQALSALGKQDPTDPAAIGEPVVSLLDVSFGSDPGVVPFEAVGNDPPSIFLLTRTLRL